MPQSIYQLDPTGANPNNLITNDIFSIVPNQNTAIVPSQGLYFADSLIVTDSNTKALLVRDTDYICIALSGEMTGKYGQEICNAVLFLGTRGTTSVSLTYQCLGSSAGAEVPQMQQLLQNVTATSSQLEWFNVVNKPLLYTPNNHVNMLSDIYGFEPVVYAIERLTDIIKLAQIGNNQLVLNYVNNQLGGICYQMSTVQYGYAGSTEISINYSYTNNVLNNTINYTNAPNGLTLAWELTNNIATIASNYYPISGIFACNNYQNPPQQGNVVSNAPLGVVPGTVFALSLMSPCSQFSNVTISWYTYTNGFPDPANQKFSLGYSETYHYPFMPPSTSRTFKKSFNSGRRYVV
jgi:hypothetical protein